MLSKDKEDIKKRQELMDKAALIFGAGVIASVIGGIAYAWYTHKPPPPLSPEKLAEQKLAADKHAIEKAAKELKKMHEKIAAYIKDPGIILTWKETKAWMIGIASVTGIAYIANKLLNKLEKWEKSYPDRVNEGEYGIKYREAQRAMGMKIEPKYVEKYKHVDRLYQEKKRLDKEQQMR